MPKFDSKMPNYACCVQTFTRIIALNAPKMVDMCRSQGEQTANREDYTIIWL